MRFEVLAADRVRAMDGNNLIELTGQLGLLLRVLLVADGGIVAKEEISRLLKVKDTSVASYVKNLRIRLDTDGVVESNSTVGYRIDPTKHTSDIEELLRHLEACEALVRGYDPLTLPPSIAAEVLDRAGTADQLWKDNPAVGLEETRTGAVAMSYYATRRLSLIRLLNLARVCVGDARTLGEAIHALEIGVSGEGDLPDESAWAQLAVAYYRDGQVLKAERVFRRAEAFYDQMDAALPPVLHELRRRVKLNDQTLTDASPVTHADALTLSPEIEKYLARVIEMNDRLLFGDPTVDSQRTAGLMSLQSAFVPLRALDVLEAEREFDVTEALEWPDYRYAVLIGEPGSGKSTIVRYLSAKRAHDIFANRSQGTLDEVLLPINVRLVDVVSTDSALEMLWSGVRELRDLPNATVATNQLELWMQKGRAAICFDGLDEVHSDAVADVTGLIESIRARYPHCRIIVTCRTHEYQSAQPSRRLPLPTIRLVPLGVDHIMEFVDRWNDSLQSALSERIAHERRHQLKALFRTNQEMARIGEVPLLLMVVLLTDLEGDVGEISFATLYERMLAQLLSEQAQWRTGVDSDGVDELDSDMLAAACAVAFGMHSGEESDEGMGRGGIALAQIEALLAADQAADNQTPEQYVQSRLETLAQVSRLTRRNGVLAEQGPGKYAFVHRSLQELLAGSSLLASRTPKQIAEFATRDHWREPLLLATQAAARQERELDRAKMLDVTGIVVDEARHSDQRHLVIAGELLVELGRSYVDEKRPGLWGVVSEGLFELVTQTSAEEIAMRIRTLSVLGRLGDPRFVDRAGIAKPFTTRVVWLDARTGPVGTNTVVSAPNEKNEPTTPVRTVAFDPIAPGIHPVTNLEYAQFIAGGGYDDARYWTSLEARMWLHGDATLIEQLAHHAASKIERDYGPEMLELFRGDRNKAFEDIHRTTSRRSNPIFWHDSRFNQATQPVVGISWWEANAYCAWLTDLGHQEGWLQSTQCVRLPTEWEWERSCGYVVDENGDDTLEIGFHRWGESHRRRAHTRLDDLGIDRPTPVGAFADGATSTGLHDLVGNVWEWTSSLCIDYDPENDPRRECIDGIEERTVRGGSWFAREPQLKHPYFRTYALPFMAYIDLGFRAIIADVPTS